MKKMIIQQKNRNYSIDMIKIIATCLIVFHHYQQFTGAQFNKVNFITGKFYFGFIVELFFIISGYFSFDYIKKFKIIKLTLKNFI